MEAGGQAEGSTAVVLVNISCGKVILVVERPGSGSRSGFYWLQGLGVDRILGSHR